MKMNTYNLYKCSDGDKYAVPGQQGGDAAD